MALAICCWLHDAKEEEAVHSVRPTLMYVILSKKGHNRTKAQTERRIVRFFSFKSDFLLPKSLAESWVESYTSNATNQHVDDYDDLQEVKVASLLWKRIWTMGLYFLPFPFFQGPVCTVITKSSSYLPMIHLSKMQASMHSLYKLQKPSWTNSKVEYFSAVKALNSSISSFTPASLPS